MGRGKDGFDALLVESEGGTAKEIVHEENGILISMLIRQYFMSLKIMGRWKHWGNSMHGHWQGIHKELHKVQPVVRPSKSGASTPVREVPEAAKPLSSHLREEVVYNREEDIHPDSSDDEDHQHPHDVNMGELRKREQVLARKTIRKWWRLAGLPGHPKCADGLDEGELEVDWTHVSRLQHAEKIDTDFDNRQLRRD